MNPGQLAALVAAAFFAVAMCAAVYVLAKLGRLVGAATTLVTSYQAGADELLARCRAAVERADEQLARTGALADGVDEVTASMSELSEQVSAVAGTARVIATGLGTPVLRLAAAGHGVRYAIALRRSGQAPGGPRIGSARLRALPDGSLRDEPGTALAAKSDPGRDRHMARTQRIQAARGRTTAAAGHGERITARRGERRHRETWRERTERVRAARDEAVAAAAAANAPAANGAVASGTAANGAVASGVRS